MKDRIKELWQRDVQMKLSEGVDYFIIINKDGEVAAVEYSLLCSILVFSQYSFALSASEKFGKDTTVEKVTRDQLYDRFSEKFDFFELDSELYVDKIVLHSHKNISSSLDAIVELLDRRISEKLSEWDKLLVNVNMALNILENRFSELECSLDTTIKNHLKEHSEKHKKYLQKETRDEMRRLSGDIDKMLTDAVRNHFAQMSKRNGNFKL